MKLRTTFLDVDTLLVRAVRSHHRRVIIKRILTAVIVTVTIIVVLLILKMHNVLREDLSLLLTPGEIAISAEQGATSELRFNLRTNNYLFCTAVCSYVVHDLSGGDSLTESGDFLLSNADRNMTFNLTAPEHGEGVKLYSFRVTCKNRENFLCTRPSREERTTALITLAYTLSPEEDSRRNDSGRQLNSTLSLMKVIDEKILRAREQLSLLGEDRVPLDGLRDRLRSLQGEHDASLKTLEEARQLWTAEQFDLTLPRPGDMERRVDVFLLDIAAYVDDQHRLLDELSLGINALYGERRSVVFAALNESTLLDAATDTLDNFIELASKVEQSPLADVRTRLLQLEMIRNESAALDAEALLLVIRESVRLEAAFTDLLNRTLSALGPNNTLEITLPPMDTGELSQSLSTHQQRCAALNTLVNLSRTQGVSLSVIPGVQLRCTTLRQEGTLPLIPLGFRQAILPDPQVSSGLELLQSVPPQCCLNAECRPCCHSCAPSPIIYLHGHSFYERNSPEFSLGTFHAIQERLDWEGIVIDGGVVTPYSAYVAPANVLSTVTLPIGFAGTYYYDAYLRGDSYVLSSAKSESIDTYAIRLQEIIDGILLRTGSDKVIIVAHSMGGLVARRNLQLFGSDDVKTLITIATPHAGVDSSASGLCPFFGANRECAELDADSPFLAKLNDPSRRTTVPVVAIVGSGCDTGDADGDGVVTVDSAALSWMEEHRVVGSCPSAGSLHTDLLDPTRAPDAYATLREILTQII